jgi:peroxiredoxin
MMSLFRSKKRVATDSDHRIKTAKQMHYLQKMYGLFQKETCGEHAYMTRKRITFLIESHFMSIFAQLFNSAIIWQPHYKKVSNI